MPGQPWWNVAPCGTDAAYQRHRYKGEPIDERCREAHARDMRFRRSALRDAGYRWDAAANRYAPPGAGSAA